MKKMAVGLALALTVGLGTVTAFAAPTYNNTVYTPTQQVAQTVYDEAATIQNYIAAQEARIAYLQDLYNKGLITRQRLDLSVANIQANIDYVRENGFGTPYGGYGFGGCCGWGW